MVCCLQHQYRTKSSQEISCVNVEFVSNISETVSVSVIRGWCDECCVCMLYLYTKLSSIWAWTAWRTVDGVRWSVKVLINCKSLSLAKQPFLSHSLLRRFCKVVSGFIFFLFGFHNNNFFYSARLSASCPSPQPGELGPVFMSPVTGWPSYTPRYWVPFLLPSMTCRAMVEVL
jgi:hypothetical protein